MTELDIENFLCRKLRMSELRSIRIKHSTSAAQTLLDLIGEGGFEIIQDDSRWNQNRALSVELFGNLTPDIVLRSRASGENRILIEVKVKEQLRYGIPDSQIVRYFLHLLATTNRTTKGPKDIERAVLLAAPSSWFDRDENAEKWTYFVTHFKDLSRTFDITLGEIRCDDEFFAGGPTC